MSVAGQVIISGAIGGTAEALGGGKFANGAVTGAYVMMFNHLHNEMEQRKQERQIERALTSAGVVFKGLESGMKASYLSLDQMRDVMIASGKPTAKIEALLMRDATIGGVARIGGHLLFWGQAGYDAYHGFFVDFSIENTPLRIANIAASRMLTYGGPKSKVIAVTYFLGKEAFQIINISLEQDLIRAKPYYTAPLQNFSPGLSPSPFIWNW